MLAGSALLPDKLETPNLAPILWLLAPWPIIASAIILIVGYTRRRTSFVNDTG
jgi:hypothetical protein